MGIWMKREGKEKKRKEKKIYPSIIKLNEIY